ncbi:MAG: T9SS type A sorting domain-containing protein [Bacteroidales bacterium]|nr:T9SS type A sorting domain-containing protein [Bacteroidales bacterium]
MKTKVLLTASLMMVMLSATTFSQWSTSPLVNNQVTFMPGDQTQCYVATHPNGNTFISWFSAEAGGNYYPRIQLYDIEGNQQWANDGLLVSNHPSMTWITDYDMTVSSDGGCIIAFQDTRTGSNDAFIYKISASGEFLWGDDGIQLSNDTDFDADPKLLATDDGGAYVAWPKAVDNGDSKVIVQRITASGQKAWSNDLVLGETGFDFAWPQIVSDGSGGAIVTLYKEWGPYWAPNRNILAQRFDEDGNALWPTYALLFTGGIIQSYVHQQAVADGAGGAWVCWFYEQTSGHLSTFVQHVDENAVVAFPLGGFEATTNMATLSLEPAMCANESTHDVYLMWRETNIAQSQYGLFGQRIDLAGSRLWGNNGKQFVPVGSQNPILINLSPLGSGGVVSYIYDAASGTNGAVRSIRFDDAGTQVWTTSPVDVSSVASPKGKLDAGNFLSGQMIVAWADGRTGNSDVFAQNVTEEGTLGPLSFEVTVTPDTLFFLTPESITDGVPFTIENTGGNPLDITYIQPYGAPVGNFTLWYISPEITNYPVPLNPGEELTETVYWIITDGYPGSTVFDTLEIQTTAGDFNLIIAVDSVHIWMGQEEMNTEEIRIFPNPFSQQVNVSMDIGSPTQCQVVIYNPQMKAVKTLLDRDITAGSIQLTWDGTDDAGTIQPPGIYYIRIQSNNGSTISKIIKLR